MRPDRKQEISVPLRCPSCLSRDVVIEDDTNVTYCRCRTCGVIIHLDGRKTRIAVSGKNAVEVQEVSLALLEKTKSSRISPSPWVSVPSISSYSL
jgi:uncharacterized Zn finger protein